MLVVWILFALMASLLVLLAVPIDLAFSIHRRGGRRKGSVTVGWLFGLVQFRPGMAGAKAPAKPAHPEARRRRPKPGGARRLVRMLYTEGLGGRLLTLARDLLRRIRIRELRLQVRLGLDDPADTGRLWAVIGPLSAMYGLPPVARIAIEPEFAGEVFEYDGRGRIRIIPIQLLFVLLAFLFSPGTLRALRIMGAGTR